MDASEPTSGKTQAAVERVPAGPALNKALTIPARKLLSSPACLNCGTDLKGPFCYYCGQPDKNLLRFFPALVRDVLEDVIDLDSRFVRTLKPLLLHPGKLTRDYLDGRRFRYVPPMRLYIFSSMAFFILATTLAGNAIDIIGGAEGKPGGLHVMLGEEDVKDLESVKALEGTDAGDAVAAALATEGTESATTDADQPASGKPEEEDDTIIFNGKPWNRETNPMIIPGMPDFINDWVNDEIEESPQKGREIEANPGLIVDKIFDVLPVAVFVMLPLVALLFKFWYLFARKYYVEHLIHALHNHAFLFLIFILTLLADSVANWLDPSEAGRPSEIASWITIVLLSWIPLYLLISLRTVYRQGWTMTLAKFSLIGISYVVLLSLVTSAAAVASFILL